MNTLTKLVLGAMGALRPLPAHGAATKTIQLPPPELSGGASLLEALSNRRYSREYRNDPLPLALLSNLLWAANGVNRSDDGRTAPSALNAQEIDIVVALPDGAYRFNAVSHALELVCAKNLRRVTGYQDFVDDAPLDLVYVADHARMKRVPVAQRLSFASVAAGAIAQNVYLFAAIAHALGIPHDQKGLLSQTVGFGKG